MPYRFRDFELNPQRYQLTREGEPVDVPRRIFELLLLLIRHRDRPVTKEEILATVWQGRAVTDASLTHAIATARRALGDSPKSQDTIKTVHKRGYWWVAETLEAFDEPADVRTRPFVGRAEALRTLSGALDEARAGRREFVLVVGEAGVGKSSLVARFQASLRSQGVLVAVASTEDLNPLPPLYLWRQVLATLARHGLISPATRRRLGKYFSVEIADHSEGAARDTDLALQSLAAKQTLFEDLVAALSEARRDGPVVVVLEDLHNADVASLEALHFLVSQPIQFPCLLVATHRPIVQAGDSTGDRLRRLTRVNGIRSIVLPNLTPQEVRDLLEHLSDSMVPPSRSEIVHRASGGNPFMLWQLVALYRARLRTDPAAGVSTIPSTIRQAIAAHTDGLPERCRPLLDVAAVCGTAFDLLVVSAASGVATPAASALLKTCADAGIVRPRTAHRFEFSHSLLRDALYDDIDSHQRSLLHLAVADSIREIYNPTSGDHILAMAHHYRDASDVGGREKAIAALRACGDLAMRSLAFQDAARLYTEALELSRVGTHNPGLHGRLLLAAGSARLCAGDRDGARDALVSLADLASAEGDGELLTEAALNFSPGVLSIEVGIVDSVLIDVLDRSLQLLSGAQSETRTELAGRLAQALYWSDDASRQRTASQVLAVGARSTVPSERTRALLYRVGSGWSPNDLGERQALLDDLSNKHRDLPQSLAPVVRVYRVATFLETNSLSAMDREVGILESELASSGAPYCAWYPTMFRATQALCRGEFERALSLAKAYLEIGERFGDSNVVNSFAAHWGEVQWLTGNAARSMDVIDPVAKRFPALPEWTAVRILFLTLTGRREEAQANLAEIRQSGFSQIRNRHNMSFVITACLLAESVFRLGLEESAQPLLDLLLPYRGRNAVAGYGVLSWGAVSRFLGQMAYLCGQGDLSLELLEEAIGSDSFACSAPWVARSEVALARALLRFAGEKRRAQELATNAARRAEGCGMLLIASDARAVIDLAK